MYCRVSVPLYLIITGLSVVHTKLWTLTIKSLCQNSMKNHYHFLLRRTEEFESKTQATPENYDAKQGCRRITLFDHPIMDYLSRNFHFMLYLAFEQFTIKDTSSPACALQIGLKVVFLE